MPFNYRHSKRYYGIIEHQITLEEQLQVAELRRDAAFAARRPHDELAECMTEVKRLLPIMDEVQRRNAGFGPDEN